MPMSGTKTECCQFGSCPLIGLVFPQSRTRLNRNSAHINAATVTICNHASALRPKTRSFDLSSEYSNTDMCVDWLRLVSLSECRDEGTGWYESPHRHRYYALELALRRTRARNVRCGPRVANTHGTITALPSSRKN